MIYQALIAVCALGYAGLMLAVATHQPTQRANWWRAMCEGAGQG